MGKNRRRENPKAVFLDRDGTINWNEERGGRPYAPNRLEDFHFLPGVAEAITRFKDAGLMVIVITNQPDLATGKTSAEVLDAMHDRLREELGVDDIFICPHTDEAGCACRKPKPGLILMAAEKWQIDPHRSVMVGDRWRDVEAGRTAGCTTVYIDRSYSGEPEAQAPDLVVGSLGEAANFICEHLSE